MQSSSKQYTLKQLTRKHEKATSEKSHELSVEKSRESSTLCTLTQLCSSFSLVFFLLAFFHFGFVHKLVSSSSRRNSLDSHLSCAVVSPLSDEHNSQSRRILRNTFPFDLSPFLSLFIAAWLIFEKKESTCRLTTSCGLLAETVTSKLCGR